jgi:hypothetical protein
MFDFAVTWALHNPLPCVGVLVGVSIAIGLLLIPALHDVSGHGHPRC